MEYPVCIITCVEFFFFILCPFWTFVVFSFFEFFSFPSVLFASVFHPDLLYSVGSWLLYECSVLLLYWQVCFWFSCCSEVFQLKWYLRGIALTVIFVWGSCNSHTVLCKYRMVLEARDWGKSWVIFWSQMKGSAFAVIYCAFWGDGTWETKGQ